MDDFMNSVVSSHEKPDNVFDRFLFYIYFSIGTGCMALADGEVFDIGRNYSGLNPIL